MRKLRRGDWRFTLDPVLMGICDLHKTTWVVEAVPMGCYHPSCAIRRVDVLKRKRR